MRLIYEKDGQLHVVSPAKGVSFSKVVERAIPVNVEFYEIDESELPPDRYFRDAWAISSGKPVVDMAKAQVIQMAKIRKARDKRLKALDVDYMVADESGNNALKSQIAQEKARLRDIPQTFDLSAETSEQLKELWPVGLPRI